MTKPNRAKVTKMFRQFMKNKGFMEHDYMGIDREDTWIMKTPFGPVWVRFEPAEHHKDGFTLFCQVLLFPSNYPNGIKPWYQFTHWKRNAHPDEHPDPDTMAAYLIQHVKDFFSTPYGQPDDKELWGLMLEKSAGSQSKAKTILSYYRYYEVDKEDQKAPEPAEVGAVGS